jgi:hypothetical protein
MAALNETRKAVLAEIVKVMAAAKARGDDEMKAARETFPGTPEWVLLDALVRAEADEVERWWQSVERTVDAEVIRKAIAGAGEAGG